MLVNVIGQRKIFKDKKSGFMHFVLFYVFFIIQIGLIELILKGFIKGYELVPFPYKLGTYTEMMVRQTVEVAKRRNKPIIPLLTSLSGEMEAKFWSIANYLFTDQSIHVSLSLRIFSGYYMNRSDTLIKQN